MSPEQIGQLRPESDSKFAAWVAAGQSALTDEPAADQQVPRRHSAAGLLSEDQPPRRHAAGTERFTPVPIPGGWPRRSSPANGAEAAELGPNALQEVAGVAKDAVPDLILEGGMPPLVPTGTGLSQRP